MAADNLTLGVFPEQVVIGLTVGVEALVHADRILGFTHKEKLPTCNVFYEARVFSRGVPDMALRCGEEIFDYDFGTVTRERSRSHCNATCSDDRQPFVTP